MFLPLIETGAIVEHFGRMPRFFFNVRDDLDTRDPEGVELPNADAARERALNEARQLMCETLKLEGRVALNHRIEIQDERRRLVAVVAFEEAIQIEK